MPIPVPVQGNVFTFIHKELQCNRTWLIKVKRVIGEWINLYLLRISLRRSKMLGSGLFSKEIGMWSGYLPFLNFLFLYSVFI